MFFVTTDVTLWNNKDLVTNFEVKKRDKICFVYPEQKKNKKKSCLNT